MKNETTKSKTVKKKTVKKQIGRDKSGRFTTGNTASVKWTEKTMIPELNKILTVLSTDESGDNYNNIVRANDIKYAEEAVFCAGVELATWEYWNTTAFQNQLPKDSAVFMLIKKIKKICELRLSYSGGVMDIFHLKNHYGYRDKTEQDVTVNGFLDFLKETS